MALGRSGTVRSRSLLIHEYVTGGGLAGAELPPSLAAEGAAMRRTLAAGFAALPGVRVSFTLDARLPDEPGPWSVVRVGPDEELDAVDRLVADADYTLLIAPEFDGILFDRARRVDRQGGRSLGADARSIAETGNKLVAYRRLSARGVPTVPTQVAPPPSSWPRRIAFPAAELARVCPFVEVPEPLADVPLAVVADSEVEHPGVLKPVDGAGALHTTIVAGEAPWPDPSWSPAVAVLQPWVEGEPMSAAVLVSATGRAHLLGVGRQRIAVERGRVRYEGGLAPCRFDAAELEAIARAVAAFPGLRGFVGVDYVRTPTGPVVLEVNPRATTSIVAYAAILGPAVLAGAWFDLVAGGGDRLPIGVLDRIRRRYDAPVRFDADGTIREGGDP